MFRNPTTDLIVVLVIVLLIFGPKRLPSLGRSLGSGLREFKDSITGADKNAEDEQRPEIAATSAPPVSETPQPPAAASAQASPPPPATQAPPAPAAPERESAEVGSDRSA